VAAVDPVGGVVADRQRKLPVGGEGFHEGLAGRRSAGISGDGGGHLGQQRMRLRHLPRHPTGIEHIFD
jgi:hypothetical protein